MNLMWRIDLDKTAKQIPGASGAETKARCTEAGMSEFRKKRLYVQQEEFELAVPNVIRKDSEANESFRRVWK